MTLLFILKFKTNHMQLVSLLSLWVSHPQIKRTRGWKLFSIHSWEFADAGGRLCIVLRHLYKGLRTHGSWYPWQILEPIPRGYRGTTGLHLPNLPNIWLSDRIQYLRQCVWVVTVNEESLVKGSLLKIPLGGEESLKTSVKCQNILPFQMQPLFLYTQS